jgi:hypothetical protein
VTVFLVIVVAGLRTEEEKFEVRKRLLSRCNSQPNSKQVHFSYSNSISFLSPLKTEKVQLFARFQFEEGILVHFLFKKLVLILGILY